MSAAQAEIPHQHDTMVEMSLDQTGLTLHWATGGSSFFHYLWLRDCCYCDACGDSESSLRQYVPGQVPVAIKPLSCDVVDGDLVITWAHDGHRSRYSLGWLFENQYGEVAHNERRAMQTLWTAGFQPVTVTFDFESAQNDDATRIDLYRTLNSHGFAIVRGGPGDPGAVTRFANLIGEVTRSAYGDVFDLAPSNTVGTAGTTSREVVPHTDEAFSYSPPGILSLACIRDADDGGDTILVDGFDVIEKLRSESPDAVDLLARWNHSFIRRHPGKLDQRAEVPIISLDHDGSIAGLRLHTRSSGPLKLPQDVTLKYLQAYHRLCALIMAPEHQIRLKLAPGDAAIFDNHRVLHSRTAFTDPRRFLQICSVQRERFHENYRLLAAKLGHDDEANCILSAGAIR